MGAFATGFLLFGIALIYGSTGSFDVHVINNFSVTNPKDLMFVMGIMLMLVAISNFTLLPIWQRQS
jgi:NADH-quinone oxidoreductase subunit N